LGCVTTNREAKITPVENSINGYCHDIRALQRLHLPLKKRKLNTGTSSQKRRGLWQEVQKDLPPKVRPEFQRRATTLRKLPTMRPSKKRNKIGNI
jgi:hypothetical protein